jgi:hypothetical protein
MQLHKELVFTLIMFDVSQEVHWLGFGPDRQVEQEKWHAWQSGLIPSSKYSKFLFFFIKFFFIYYFLKITILTITCSRTGD